MGCSDGMLEPSMSRTWENILETSQLLYMPQSLKMRSINESPDNLREVNEPVDIVVDLPFLVRIKLHSPASADLLEGNLKGAFHEVVSKI